MSVFDMIPEQKTHIHTIVVVNGRRSCSPSRCAALRVTSASLITRLRTFADSAASTCSRSSSTRLRSRLSYSPTAENWAFASWATAASRVQFMAARSAVSGVAAAYLTTPSSGRSLRHSPATRPKFASSGGSSTVPFASPRRRRLRGFAQMRMQMPALETSTGTQEAVKAFFSYIRLFWWYQTWFSLRFLANLGVFLLH